MNDKIFDIIIFGSLVKGGIAQDVDIAVVLQGNIDQLQFKKKISSLIDKILDVQFVDVTSIHSSMWMTLLKEGYSVGKEKYLFELYNLIPRGLYKFSLSKLNNVQKVQFERGIKKTLAGEGEMIARSVVLVPIYLQKRMVEFLKSWNVYYECQEYELVPVLRKEEL